MKANILGISVQKIASNWIYRIIEDHPQAILSTKKEIDCFSYYDNHPESVKQLTDLLGEKTPWDY